MLTILGGCAASAAARGIEHGCYCWPMGAKPPLSVSDPGLVMWFDLEANGCSADEAVSGMLWWRCDVVDDYRWQQQASAMRRRPGCGFCAGKRVAKSNCAATLYRLQQTVPFGAWQQ